MQYRPLKITYSFFHCHSDINNNDNELPLSCICFSFFNQTFLIFLPLHFGVLLTQNRQSAYSMTQIPQVQISQGRQACANKKYIFKLWDKLSVTQIQNYVFIFDSFSTISHMNNQSSNCIDFFLYHVIYLYFFLHYSHFSLLWPLSHASSVCSIALFL